MHLIAYMMAKTLLSDIFILVLKKLFFIIIQAVLYFVGQVINIFKQVGVYERQNNHAYALYFYYYMPIFFYSFNEAHVILENTVSYSDALSELEVFSGINMAFGCAVGSQ